MHNESFCICTWTKHHFALQQLGLTGLQLSHCIRKPQLAGLCTNHSWDILWDIQGCLQSFGCGTGYHCTCCVLQLSGGVVLCFGNTMSGCLSIILKEHFFGGRNQHGFHCTGCTCQNSGHRSCVTTAGIFVNILIKILKEHVCFPWSTCCHWCAKILWSCHNHALWTDSTKRKTAPSHACFHNRWPSIKKCCTAAAFADTQADSLAHITAAEKMQQASNSHRGRCQTCSQSPSSLLCNGSCFSSMTSKAQWGCVCKEVLFLVCQDNLWASSSSGLLGRQKQCTPGTTCHLKSACCTFQWQFCWLGHFCALNIWDVLIDICDISTSRIKIHGNDHKCLIIQLHQSSQSADCFVRHQLDGRGLGLMCNVVPWKDISFSRSFFLGLISPLGRVFNEICWGQSHSPRDQWTWKLAPFCCHLFALLCNWVWSQTKRLRCWHCSQEKHHFQCLLFCHCDRFLKQNFNVLTMAICSFGGDWGNHLQKKKEWWAQHCVFFTVLVTKMDKP